MSVFQPIVWLRNQTRNGLRGSLLGRALLQVRPSPPLKSVRIVSATRMSEKDFWRNSALGRSLKPWMLHPQLSVEVAFQNRAGLPEVYNRQLEHSTADVLLFVHDDLWLDDPTWLPKLLVALERFDVVGLAGNRRRLPRQPAWAFSALEDGEAAVWDRDHLSGAVGHGERAHGPVSAYGPSPARCRLLDGVFIAVRVAEARRSSVRFDTRFAFHFYDLDFCRAADRAGLSLGTWPIAVTHQSGGSFGSPSWKAGRDAYFAKWRR